MLGSEVQDVKGLNKMIKSCHVSYPGFLLDILQKSIHSMSARFRQHPMTNTLERGAMKMTQIMHRHVGWKVWSLKFYGWQ